MAILEIKKFTNSALRKKCEEVKEITPEIEKLVGDMIETMRENKGIGLAASQLGILKKIIVVQPNLKNSEVFAFINPKIIKKSPQNDILEEGCLSFPGIFLYVDRPKEIEVQGLDINGDKITIKASGIVSHIFQHEIDHLDGVLFFNRLKFFKKIRFKLKHPWL